MYNNPTGKRRPDVLRPDSSGASFTFNFGTGGGDATLSLGALGAATTGNGGAVGAGVVDPAAGEAEDEITGGSVSGEATALGAFSFSLNFGGSDATGTDGSSSLKSTGRTTGDAVSAASGTAGVTGASGARRGFNENGEAGFGVGSTGAAAMCASTTVSEISSLGRSLKRGASTSAAAESATGGAGGT